MPGEPVEGTSSAQRLAGPNRLLLHPFFKETITALKDVKIALPRVPIDESEQSRERDFPATNSKLEKVEGSEKHELSATKGEEIAASETAIAAYDESINKFSALQGTAYLTSHSLVTLGPSRYVPTALLTFYFYSRSKYLAARTGRVRYSETPQMESQKDYMQDKISFLLDCAPANSLLFVDGPLIAGDVYVRMVGSMAKFLARGILPIFLVKNSDSSLITDATPDLQGRFNSDLHWAHEILQPGERTSLYKYVDLHNPKQNAKVFCYFKSLRTSPARVEFHADVFDRYSDRIHSILNLIHYLMLVQGDAFNPQIRPIAIAEKFARASIKLIDLEGMMRSSGLQPTMNQERGMVIG